MLFWVNPNPFKAREHRIGGGHCKLSKMSDFDLSDLSEALADKPTVGKAQPVTLEEICQLIREKVIKNVVTVVGAGVSTAAGIPDFRSPKEGLYDNLQEYNLSSPMDIFCIDYFRTNPEPFFKLAKRLYKPEAKPTLAHYFVKLLHNKALLKRHYTQNVDDLETLCGLPEETVVQAHGSFRTGHCLKCNRLYDFDWMKNLILDDQIPKCSMQHCSGVVKPDVVFFGEGLPRKFFSCIQQDLLTCDLLIIMGTSLTVAPFCSIPHLTSPETYRIYINRAAADVTFNGLPWDDPENRVDVLFRGDADDGVSRIAELLGWTDELVQLKNSTDPTNRSSNESVTKSEREVASGASSK